ncbi:MAG: integrase [Methylobacterium sp. CG08_land_8_20_14_0_20_71_15]|nr:MAG: integrase [Methylobacterium sp. CG09_land_8_20_14_0_10_71_15]PIU11115.1 MAG: integrase [Methylobacterium sp. CG08_land_8_20_14_0_20_71_15]GBU16510.1 integrase [Methylobacterium sp.]
MTAPDQVSKFVRLSLSPNTRRAYLSDIDHFAGWGGVIPSSAETVARYLADCAGTLRIATLKRRLASITKAHAAIGAPTPVSDEIVRATLRGIRRSRSVPRKEAKPLLREELFAVLDGMGTATRDVRDRALLLIGFAGGFRRSELVGLDHADIEPVRQGIVIHLRRSKTDQAGEGRRVGIPHGRTRHGPVQALDRWITLSCRTRGPLFSPITRGGSVGAERLSGEAVSVIVKRRVAAVGIDPNSYSGHSLRAGFATSAAQIGVPSWKIRAQTGHASDAMLAHYIRIGEIFVENPAGILL